MEGVDPYTKKKREKYNKCQAAKNIGIYQFLFGVIC